MPDPSHSPLASPRDASSLRRRESTYDVVAFDFDGTLADTTRAILATIQSTLHALELAPVEPHQVFALIGLPLGETFGKLGVPTNRVPECVTVYRSLFPTHSASVRLFPGARACLHELTELGVPMTIVSSRGRTSLLELVRHFEISNYFAAILGEEDVPRKKPAPDLVLAIAQTLGVATDRILVVGDTTYDIEMGHAAGAFTCAVTYGNHAWSHLIHARPHHRLDSLAALVELLR
jgi:phosphoglycolate phosphatase